MIFLLRFLLLHFALIIFVLNFFHFCFYFDNIFIKLLTFAIEQSFEYNYNFLF